MSSGKRRRSVRRPVACAILRPCEKFGRFWLNLTMLTASSIRVSLRHNSRPKNRGREHLSLRAKYLDVLSRLIPAGVAGLALALTSAAPGVAREHPADQQPSAEASVSERLAAIREAVSAIAQAVEPQERSQLA